MTKTIAIVERANANASKRLSEMETAFELEKMRSLRLRSGVTLLINQLTLEGLNPIWTLADLTKEEIDGFNDDSPHTA